MKYFFTIIITLSFAKIAFAEESQVDQPKKMILFPLAFYTPETSLGLGLINIYKFKNYAPGKVDQILSNVAVTIKGQVLANLVPKFYREDGQGELFGALNYSYFPSKYYGQGQSKVPNSDGEAFTENSLVLSVGGTQILFSKISLRGSLNYEEKKISHFDAGTSLNSLISSTTDSIQAVGGGLGLEWDDRDFLQSPTSGDQYRLQTTYLSMKDTKGSYPLPVYFRYDLDMRQYRSLSSDWVFALQLFLSDIPGSQFVPFQYLNNMGGGSRMRGLISGKYRDRTLALGQGELRFHFKEKWYTHAFLAGSRMADRTDHLAEATPKYSSGFGFQYLLDQESRTKLRFDLGFSDGESGVYVVIGEAF